MPPLRGLGPLETSGVQRERLKLISTHICEAQVWATKLPAEARLRRRGWLVAAGATGAARTASAAPSAHPHSPAHAGHADVERPGNENAVLELAAAHHVVSHLDVGQGDAFALL